MNTSYFSVEGGEKTVDLSKIKPGDEVIIRGVASTMHGEDSTRYYCGEDHLCVTVGPLVGSGKAWVPRKAIVSHRPTPMVAGDKVRARTGKLAAIIIAIDRGDAWIKWGDGTRAIVSLDSLERVQ